MRFGDMQTLVGSF